MLYVTPLAPPAPIPPFGGIFLRYPPGTSGAYPPRGEPAAIARADTPNVAGHDVLRSRSAFFGPPATQIGLSALPALQVGDYLGTCYGTRHHLQRNSVQPATQLVHTCNTTRPHLQHNSSTPATARRGFTCNGKAASHTTAGAGSTSSIALSCSRVPSCIPPSFSGCCPSST